MPQYALAADAPAPVDSARDSLGKQQYPWYDAQKDSLRPVELPRPKQNPNKKPGQDSQPGGGTTSDVIPLEGHDGSKAPTEMSEAPDLDLDVPAGAAEGFSILAWLVLILLVGSLVAVIAYLIVQNVRQKPAESSPTITRRPITAGDRLEALPQAARRHVDDLLAEARRCYQDGRYGEAIIYLFSHQLVELDKVELIRLARGKTNRQYLTEVAVRPPLRELVAQTMLVFEDAFFGNYPIERQRFENCWSQLDAFQRLVAQRTG